MKMPSFFRVRASASACGRCRIWSKNTHRALQSKKITPHKLRSTFGTNLYQETGDIYLVADVLGHADVNTTRKHYADIEDSRRRMAATRIRLRKD